MSKNGLRILAIAGLLGLGAFALHSPSQAKGLKSSFIGVGHKTLVPYGWVDFCTRYRGECRTRVMKPEDVIFSRTTLDIMRRVNTAVNNRIKPKSDQEQWRVVDHWDYPTSGKGDCEDYVLQKRKMLMQQGFPRQSLLITVVKDERGDGHAVLTVKTSAGEYILDNLNPRVRPWRKVPYRFVKRQSQADPNTWVNIGEPTSAPLVVSR